MLRHRDSRVGLISRSGPGTGQSGWERRVEAVRTRLGWRVELGRQRTRWAGIEGRLRGMSGKQREGQSIKDIHTLRWKV